MAQPLTSQLLSARMKFPGALFSSATFGISLAILVVLVNLGVFILVWQPIGENRDQAQRHAEISTRNLVHVLEEEIAAIINTADVGILSLMDEYQRLHALGPVDEKVMEPYVERMRSRLPGVDALRIADARGFLVCDNAEAATHTIINVADRPHFIQLRDNPQAGLVISSPQVSRVNHKLVIVLARRINQPDGSFGGMVFAAIELEKLSRTFALIDAGPGGVINMRSSNFDLIARYPPYAGTARAVGKASAPAPLWEGVEAGRNAGTFHGRSTLDNIDRTYSYSRVGNYPLIISVGLATNDYMAEWRRSAINWAGLTILFMLSTVLAATLFYRSLKQQAHAVKALASQEFKFRTMADYTNDWEYWQGPDREILHMTLSAERFTGYTAEEFTADPGLLLSIVHPDDRHVMEQHMCDIEEQEYSQVEFRIVRRDGEIRWIAHHCRAVHGPLGERMGRRINNRDITDRKVVDERIQYLAQHDTLTDLPNRTQLSDRLQQAIAQVRRDKSMLAVMFLDLDKFKPVNDQFGHDIGDLLLKEVAKRLQECVHRETDMVSRLGGDEFVLLLSHIKEENDAAVIAEKVLYALNQPFRAGRHKVDISASIGIALCPRHGESPLLLMKNADTAMYHAKEKGRNNYRFFNAEMDDGIN